ncbi:37S ribosomal protein MRP4, mitochondrial [Cyphellophora attinorum]|uniref:37S ribosomal protein MRP4, mitochondrial n=1 Tax=Cyphellophora attinorum TaxID=1664694 RepID=A0A0N1I047_9EURO|nr:37S ribosomal protein MRP4, mitochondrial [Phialophora attinorum]KPI44687.1 37S ribosomal protein MRP4, mitochondrial [Phialophora attinorum]
MIIRQFCARHGRTTIAKSWRPKSACYATTISGNERSLQPPAGEYQGQTTFPGHPDEASSMLDTTGLPPTPRTRAVLESLQSSQSSISATQREVGAYVSAATGGVTADPTALVQAPPAKSSRRTNRKALQAIKKQKGAASAPNRVGSHLTQTYNPSDILERPPTPEALTLPDLLAHQTHLGHHTSLWHPGNSSYIFGIRDGIHIISLDQTFAYLQRAAKVIRNVAYRGGLILFIGTRDNFAPIVTRAAQRAKGYHIFDRWVPGTLTNGQQLLRDCAVKVVDVNDKQIPSYDDLISKGKHSVIRPDLLVCLNPLENPVCLHECGLNTVPTIGIIDTDANPAWVTYPIPANDDSLRSVSLIAGVLSQAARQGQENRLAEAEATQKATYSTGPVRDWLARTQELVEIDVSESVGRQEEDQSGTRKQPTSD